jgi:hypothetical protein
VFGGSIGSDSEFSHVGHRGVSGGMAGPSAVVVHLWSGLSNWLWRQVESFCGEEWVEERGVPGNPSKAPPCWKRECLAGVVPENSLRTGVNK